MEAALLQTWDDQRLANDRQTRLQAEMRARGIGAMYLTCVGFKLF